MALNFGLSGVGGTIGPQVGGVQATFLPSIDKKLDAELAPTDADKAAIAVLKVALQGISDYGVANKCKFADALFVNATDNAKGQILITVQVQMVLS